MTLLRTAPRDATRELLEAWRDGDRSRLDEVARTLNRIAPLGTYGRRLWAEMIRRMDAEERADLVRELGRSL